MTQAGSHTTAPQKQSAAKDLFGDLSIAQLAAGALAAVTSMLLSAQIGITGSVIGVAVGSVVSAVSSQVYKKLLQRSGEKIQEVAGDSAHDGGAGGAEQNADAQKTTAYAASVSDDSSDPTRVRGAHARPQQTTDASGQAANMPAAGETVIMSGVYAEGAGETQTQERVSPTPRVGKEVPTSDSTVQKAMLQRQEKKRKAVKATVIVVSIVSALIAVAICAFVINAATAGNGLGTKASVSQIVQKSSVADKSADDTETDGVESEEEDTASDGTSTGTSGTSSGSSSTDSTSGTSTGTSGTSSGSSSTDSTTGTGSGSSSSDTGTDGTGSDSGSESSSTDTGTDSSGSASGTSGT